MPELPEVETVVRDLRSPLTGSRIVGVRVGEKRLRKPWHPDWTAHLLQQQIESVTRRGKWIGLSLAEGGRLLIHLGMTGQLRVMETGQPVESHTHLILDLQPRQQLRFRDIRRFGSATWFKDAAALEQFFAASGLGPEPFDLDPAYWRRELAKTSRNLKAVLLDQQVVAGVGNIYADESLFQARLHPALRGRDLDTASAGRLRRAVADVLSRAIERRGSTIRDYVGGSGLKGEYQNEFRVYGRINQPCPRCRTSIVRLRLAGRSTHFCPKCQRKDDRVTG
jgi:formamidopyrimidine-DNA glycosylase